MNQTRFEPGSSPRENLPLQYWILACKENEYAFTRHEYKTAEQW